MQDQTIQRLANGSIDYGYYHRRACALRAEARADFFKGRRGVIKSLAAVAVIVAPLVLAAMVHQLKRAQPIAADAIRIADVSVSLTPSRERGAQLSRVHDGAMAGR